MKINRVERHQIKKNNSCWETIDKLCFKSKNLYNYANYVIRQEFINNHKVIFYNDLASILKDSEPYRDLGSNVGQLILKMLDKNWKSFFKGIKQWSKSKGDGYLGKPKLPKYKNKDGRFILAIDNIKSHIENDYVRFSWKPLKLLNGKFKTKAKGRLIQVRFIPRGSDYIMEVVYEVEVPEITNEEIRNSINTIIIGRNKEWKQEVNLGRINNQNFVCIPFYSFIEKLKYKCENHGVRFIDHEEEHTSKASFLDGDKSIKDYPFSGKRIKRGLYRTKYKILINADVNAAYNIIKKVVPEAFVDGIEGVDLHPIRVNVI